MCDKQDTKVIGQKLEESNGSPYLAEIQHFGSYFFFCSFLGISLFGDDTSAALCNARVLLATNSCPPVRPVDLKKGGRVHSIRFMAHSNICLCHG